MVSVDRIKGLSSSLAVKAPVLAATTAPITLSGLQTIDTVSIPSGGRVLVKDQADTTQNGWYDASTSAWTRSLDADKNNDFVDGTLCVVAGGTQGGRLWRLSCGASVTVGATALTFTASIPFADVSDFILTLLNDVDAAAARDTLGAAKTGANVDITSINGTTIPTNETLLVADDLGVSVQAYTASASQAEMEAGTEANLRAMSPLRVKQAITALATSGSTDQIARDQIALTNLRLMLNSAVTTGELVQGKQWELASDEWSLASINETYTSGTPSYYTNTGVVAQAAGTVLGNMTAGGGLAAAFDGNANQGIAASAQNASAAAGYVGKDWGASNTRIITQAVVDSSNDNGFSNSFNTGTNTIALEGSTDNFSGSIVALGSTTTGTEGTARITATVTASNVTTAYRYHRIKITNSNGGSQIYGCAEVVFSENQAATLIPPAAVSVAVAPTYMDAVFLYKDDSGAAAVLGTDLTVELSRDNGTTWTVATITTLASYDGTYSMLNARANVSAQPSGTSMLCRIKTLNNKAQRVAAPALYAE